jgi:hypothetical protein
MKAILFSMLNPHDPEVTMNQNSLKLKGAGGLEPGAIVQGAF